ncbi:MAG TPA: NUDIX domain-containing protein [Jiangellaceae bacterium]
MPDVAADGRPVIRRETVRLLLIEPADRVLLFEDSDPGLPSRPRFWITPGGGIDPGESVEQAAVREVAEETGHLLSPDALRGPIADRWVVHGYSDKIVEQREIFYSAAVTPFTVMTDGHTEDERLSMLGHRWWKLDELRSTTERIWPTDLHRLLEAVLAGGPLPVTLDVTEESTVSAYQD